MLVKMEFLGITGPVKKIDEITEKYLVGRDFHLENSLSELRDMPSLSAFTDENPYKELLAQSQGLVNVFSHDDIIKPHANNLSIEEIKQIIYDLSKESAIANDKKSTLNSQINEVVHEMASLEPFKKLDANLKSLQDFQHLRMRMGRMPSAQYSNYVSYAQDEIDAIFIKTFDDDEYVYGVYFTPHFEINKVDEEMKSFGFIQTILKREYSSPPNIAYSNLEIEKKQLELELEKVALQIKETLYLRKTELITAHSSLIRLSNNFDIRNYAAITESAHQKFFVLCGWMPYEQVEEVKQLMKDDPDVYFDTNIGHVIKKIVPPTMIKNPKFFKPFESFIRMYGVPRHNEFDPTIFLALTYTLIFGIMFGDIGQGALLLIGGFVLYKLKKIDLAAIISCAGFFSIIFGFIYGSFFGFEELVEPLWSNPMKNIQAILIISISFGIGLILFTMILNIINGIRAKEWDRVLISPNGICGLIFYSSILTSIILAILKKPIPAGWILAVIIGIPLIILALQVPISNFMKGRKKLLDEPASSFVIEAFFELFEILLNYITNTISFVRIGAFALSHAGMMFVVMELSNASSGSPNWIIVILGNILVMCLEGLIVGIQVLRLEYYELFSRFYMGNGREFKSYLK